MPVIQTFVVTAAAGITASCAVYTAKKAADIAGQVDENRRRSKRNRELIAGDPDATDAIIERLDRIEENI